MEWAEFELEAMRCLMAIHADQRDALAAGAGEPSASFLTLEELLRRNAASRGYTPFYWGYEFASAPSRTEPGRRYWAVARPSDGSGPHFFVNQEGRIHVSQEPFTVDVASCGVPVGLEPVEAFEGSTGRTGYGSSG